VPVAEQQYILVLAKWLTKKVIVLKPGFLSQILQRKEIISVRVSEMARSGKFRHHIET
jgi:hypothetical protein